MHDPIDRLLLAYMILKTQPPTRRARTRALRLASEAASTLAAELERPRRRGRP